MVDPVFDVEPPLLDRFTIARELAMSWILKSRMFLCCSFLYKTLHHLSRPDFDIVQVYTMGLYGLVGMPP